MNDKTYSFKTNELTEDQLDQVMGGPERDAIVEKALQTEGIFMDLYLERERKLRKMENIEESSMDPNELTEEELDQAMGGPERDAIVEKALQTEGLFRESSLEQERMFRELETKSEIDMSSSPLFRR